MRHCRMALFSMETNKCIADGLQKTNAPSSRKEKRNGSHSGHLHTGTFRYSYRRASNPSTEKSSHAIWRNGPYTTISNTLCRLLQNIDDSSRILLVCLPANSTAEAQRRRTSSLSSLDETKRTYDATLRHDIAKVVEVIFIEEEVSVPLHNGGKLSPAPSPPLVLLQSETRM